MNPLLLIRYSDHPVLRVDLNPQASAAADNMFERAVQTFEQSIDEFIDFDAGYTLDEGECFQISDFTISDDLIDAARQPLTAERLNQAELQFLSPYAVVGYDFAENSRRLFFQNFDSRRVIIPGRRFAILSTEDASTFRELDRPIILLDGPLTAIWDDGTLKFKSFHSARQIFDLTDYFAEATNPQLEEFAAHDHILCDEPEQFISISNSWSRKKVALIMRDGILDYPISEIRRGARAVNYSLTTRNGRIVLPTAKKDLRALLQFLGEDIYQGPISRRRMLSSGHRVY